VPSGKLIAGYVVANMLSRNELTSALIAVLSKALEMLPKAPVPAQSPGLRKTPLFQVGPL